MTWRNPVSRVHFAGFSATTTQLQDSGWQVAAAQEPYSFGRPSVRLALKHSGCGLELLTDQIYLDAGILRSLSIGSPVYDELLEFRVVSAHNNTRVMYTAMPAASWSAVDAFPSSSVSELADDALANLVPFRPVNRNAHQIIVCQDSVPQVLDLLLKCQESEAAQRRARERARADRQYTVIAEAAA